MHINPQKILITHVYSSENKGDAALLSVLIDDIRRQYGKKVSIEMLTMDKITPGELFDGEPLYESFMYYALNTHTNKIAKLFYAFYVMTATTVWTRAYKHFGVKLPLRAELREVCQRYLEADMIITVGGGYFRSGPSLVSMINLLLMLHPLRLARLIGKQTYLYTQSVGPFFRGIEKKLVAREFARVPLLLIREEKSVKLLADMGIKTNVSRSVDSGFSFDAKAPYPLRSNLGLSSKDVLLGVTVRQWLDEKGQAAYEESVAGALDAIIDQRNVKVIFIPQVTSTFNKDDDRVTSRSVHARMKRQDQAFVIEETHDHYQVKAMYNQLDFILGTRFHSVIFSLTSYVPALAIEYEHKTSGIMHDLSLERWSVKMEDVTQKHLITMLGELMDNKDAYQKHLKKVLPSYIAKSKNAIVQVDERYRSTRDRR